MKKLLLSLLVLSSSLLAFSQGNWTSRDTLPHDTNATYQGIQGFSIGNYGYAGLGQNNAGKNSTDLWRFSPATNSWTKKANFPGSARVAPACFVIGDNAYLITGSVKNSGTCVTECWEYNSTINTWTQKANFPSTARTYAVGFAIDSLGYVGTGANELSDFRKDFYAYHPSTNTWTRIADFGGTARDAGNAFAVNGKGYVCFGQDSTFKTYNDIWEYDPGTNTWTQKMDNPIPMVAAIGFTICNNIYVGGGDTTSSIYSYHEFWKYSTVSDSWTQEASVPGKTRAFATAFAVGDTGYSGFGSDSVYVFQNAFYKFYAGDSCNIVDEGYNTLAAHADLSVYPNPNHGIFTIAVSHSELVSEPQSMVEIYNMFGEKVYDANLKQVQDDNIIDLREQPNGVYFISIKLANQTLYKKLIINN